MVKMYINGEWITSIDGKSEHDTNPSTGESICNFPSGKKEDVDNAIDSAESAFFRESNRTSKDRAKLLYKAANLIEDKRSDLEHRQLPL